MYEFLDVDAESWGVCWTKLELIESKDLYHVVVNPGMDQAFVFGVIAVLDYIYGESTHR